MTQHINDKSNKLRERLDSLSEIAKQVFSKEFDGLLQLLDTFEKTYNKSKIKPKTIHEVFTEDLQIKKIPYKIGFSCFHGKPDGSLSKKEELEMVIHDVIFKQEALFYTIGTISSVLIARHHKFDYEILLHSLSELGEIGYAISSELVDLTERLGDQEVEVKTDAKS